MRLLIALLLCLTWVSAAAAEKRAFIVGVGEYDELTDLKKTIGDANGYRELFEKRLKYKTTKVVHHPKRREFVSKFDDFVRSISPGDEVVFVFSGHGWSDGSDNYLSFSDAPRGVSEAVLKAETIALEQTVMSEIRKRQPKIILAIIDACRDEQYDKLTRSPGALDKGIVRVSANEGELILYSAGTGQSSLDRLSNDDPSPYSVFTRVLLPLLSDENMPLAQVANDTRKHVQALAKTVGHSQRPEMMLGIDLDYCLSSMCKNPSGRSLNRVVNTGPSAAEVERVKFERKMWDDADKEKQREAYEIYLNSFPNGIYAVEARRRLSACEIREIDGGWKLEPNPFETGPLWQAKGYGWDIDPSKSRACKNAEAKAHESVNTQLANYRRNSGRDVKITVTKRLLDRRQSVERYKSDKWKCGWETSDEYKIEARLKESVEVCP